VLLPVNSNETLLEEFSISLLKNTRQIVLESCFESNKILLSTVALESRLSQSLSFLFIFGSTSCCPDFSDLGESWIG
jgi:hypothetical protein